mgnify:FL=1
MKNKYQKPAIYLTPEHTEGIYLASGAAGAAGSEAQAPHGLRGLPASLPASSHRSPVPQGREAALHIPFCRPSG